MSNGSLLTDKKFTEVWAEFRSEILTETNKDGQDNGSVFHIMQNFESKYIHKITSTLSLIESLHDRLMIKE